MKNLRSAMSAQHFHYDSLPLWAPRHYQASNCRKPEFNDSGFFTSAEK
ncbi:hypothetical protein I6F53_18180 [Pseudoalteromonas sp. SWN29]|nr:hypothetical protein [Pseudoalteromonas sp. SWN29]MBH0028896.1 hypothetical protein [Pseudoalteromonas sp. SWN29]